MQTSPYNNPMLAQGLSGLVQSFIGNPNAEAQAQEAASRALLNNQTAQFRDAIGDTGMSGDLASMMIRSLQAGPDYSRFAPGIGDATIRMGALGFGGEQHTPSPAIAQLMLAGGRSGGGGGRGRASGSGGGGFTPRPMTASDQTNMIRAAQQAGVPPEAFAAEVSAGLQSGRFRSAAEAIMDAMARVGDVPGEPVVTNPGGTMLTRGIASLFGGDPSSWEPDAVRTPMQRGFLPRDGGSPTAPPPQSAPAPQAPAASGAGDSVQIINQAREAISRGADPAAIRARLQSMGIDPGGL